MKQSGGWLGVGYAHKYMDTQRQFALLCCASVLCLMGVCCACAVWYGSRWRGAIGNADSLRGLETTEGRLRAAEIRGRRLQAHDCHEATDPIEATGSEPARFRDGCHTAACNCLDLWPASVYPDLSYTLSPISLSLSLLSLLSPPFSPCLCDIAIYRSVVPRIPHYILPRSPVPVVQASGPSGPKAIRMDPLGNSLRAAFLFVSAAASASSAAVSASASRTLASVMTIRLVGSLPRLASPGLLLCRIFFFRLSPRPFYFLGIVAAVSSAAASVLPALAIVLVVLAGNPRKVRTVAVTRSRAPVAIR